MPRKPNLNRRAAIQTRKELMNEICKRIFEIYTENNNKIPHRTFKTIVEDYQQSFPTLKVPIISMAFVARTYGRPMAVQRRSSLKLFCRLHLYPCQQQPHWR